MSLKLHRLLAFCFLFFISQKSHAVTLTSGQVDYTTPGDITTSASGIISSLSGTSSSLNKIKNTHIITTGNSGATSSAYAIRSGGDYNQITNDLGASIITTGSSGRGISVSDFSIVNNLGTITTQGSTSYGIYAGGNSDVVTNSGSINTSGTTSYGIYLSGDNNSATNSGSISTKVYGIYLNGNGNQVSNSGTITTSTGSTAYGIYVSAGTSSTASASNYSLVNNSGAISSNSHGIYSKDAYAQITNSGTITTSSGSSIYGIRSEGEKSTITNSGDIISTNYAIYNSGENVVINNSGNLSGGVYVGSGTLNILSGSISGTVNGSSGIGNVVVSANFSQTSIFKDLDNLTINSAATLNSTNKISANKILIGADSVFTITTGSSVSGTIAGVSDLVGTLNISGISFISSNSIGEFGSALKYLNITSDASVTAFGDIYVSDTFLDGTLNFNGADNLTIFGNLSGSGAGIVNIDEKNQIISGNFSLAAGDELSLTLKNGGAGNIAVRGSADIAKNSKLAITTSYNQGYIASGTKYNIIEAAAGEINSVSDENISVNGANSNIYGFLKFTTDTTRNSLVLNIDRLSAKEVTTDENAQNIYNNLSEIGVNSAGKLLEFQEYLDSSGLSGNAVSKALKQLAPQLGKANLAVSNNVVLNSIKNAERRLRKIHNDFSTGIWGQTIGASATQNAVKDDEGYKANSVGMVFGIDEEMSDSATIGTALSYIRSDIKSSDGFKKTLVSTIGVSIYNEQNFGKYFLDNIVNFSWNQFSSQREIEAANANTSSRYNGQIYGAKILGGWIENFQHGLSLTPEFSVSFLHNNIGSYSEKGAEELNLKVGAMSANFLEIRAGLNLGWIAKVAEFPEFKKVASSVRISYGYSLINDAPDLVSNFEGQNSSFNSKISNVDRGSLKLGMAFYAYHAEATTFGLDYDFEKRATYQSHFVLARVKQEF